MISSVYSIETSMLIARYKLMHHSNRVHLPLPLFPTDHRMQSCAAGSGSSASPRWRRKSATSNANRRNRRAIHRKSAGQYFFPSLPVFASVCCVFTYTRELCKSTAYYPRPPLLYPCMYIQYILPSRPTAHGSTLRDICI